MIKFRFESTDNQTELVSESLDELGTQINEYFTKLIESEKEDEGVSSTTK
jgi:hypothetical protein